MEEEAAGAGAAAVGPAEDSVGVVGMAGTMMTSWGLRITGLGTTEIQRTTAVCPKANPSQGAGTQLWRLTPSKPMEAEARHHRSRLARYHRCPSAATMATQSPLVTRRLQESPPTSTHSRLQ